MNETIYVYYLASIVAHQKSILETTIIKSEEFFQLLHLVLEASAKLPTSILELDYLKNTWYASIYTRKTVDFECQSKVL